MVMPKNSERWMIFNWRHVCGFILWGAALWLALCIEALPGDIDHVFCGPWG